MTVKNTPGSHPDHWLDLLRGYVTGAVESLNANGLQVRRSWLDPSCPRDATIVLANDQALVFDEVTGWRSGWFVSGRQGLRTELADLRYLGGGVLLSSSELAHRVVHGQSSPRYEYRSFGDLRDGFDDALHTFGAVR